MPNEAQKESMAIAWVEGVRLAAEVRTHRVIMDLPVWISRLAWSRR